jgi:hypothetical protein
MQKVQDLVGEISSLEYEDKSTEQRIEDAEQLTRDLIHERLKASNGDSYWEILPSGVVSDVESRLDGNMDEIDPRERLEFVDLSDCAEIINIHWSEFNDDFPDNDDVEHHLKNLEFYRDEYGEAGEVDRYTKLDGNLAIQWIHSCVDTRGEAEA